MAKFDVHKVNARIGYVVDCQSDLNRAFDTRVVVPLVPTVIYRPVDLRLNPIFRVDGRDYVFAVQALRTVTASVLGVRITSLAEHDIAITEAIDRLFFGI